MNRMAAVALPPIELDVTAMRLPTPSLIRVPFVKAERGSAGPPIVAISHATVLVVYEVSDANPTDVRIVGDDNQPSNPLQYLFFAVPFILVRTADTDPKVRKAAGAALKKIP